VTSPWDVPHHVGTQYVGYDIMNHILKFEYKLLQFIVVIINSFTNLDH
jgi:hypothetical protein